MENQVSQEKVEKYFSVTKEALQEAKNAPHPDEEKTALILDMAERYVADATHYYEKGDWVTAFAALNYAHGWLDCGASLGFFTVTNNKLFTVDEE